MSDVRYNFQNAMDSLNEAKVSNTALDAAIKAKGKEKAYAFFQKAMNDAGPAIAKDVFAKLNGLVAGDIVDFVEGLHSESKISGHNIPSSGVAFNIFDLKPVGIGRGEVYCAWLYKNAFIQGGNESFDVQQGKTKYEVKEYTRGNNGSAIRIGVEGSISKFDFWKEILKTVDQIKEIEGTDGKSWDLLPATPDLKTLKATKDYIIKRVEEKIKIVTGEFGKKDLKQFISFYESADKVLKSFETTGDYNQVVLRGPNAKPKSIIIEPVSATDIPSSPNDLTVTIQNAQDGATTETVINFLKRLKYLRNPAGFQNDINAEVANLLSKGEADHWIIYRGKSAPFTQKVYSRAEAVKSFTFETISQNGIKFTEPK